MKKACTLILMFSCLFSFAQEDKMAMALQKFSEQYPQQRMHVQLSKAEYLAGETIYFKSFIFSGNGLSNLSTNLYVEWMDKNKKVLHKQIIPVVLGVADGAFDIPESSAEDVYYFRAYTVLMLSAGEQAQFIQPINVYNPASATRLQEQPIGWTATIHPEGGSLIDSIETRVAVRLRPTGRLPQQWSGYLFEQSNPKERVGSFSSINGELGTFNFIPVFNHQYFVVTTDNNNYTDTVALPAVNREGVTIKVASRAGRIAYRVKASWGKSLQGYKITAQAHNEIIYTAAVNVNRAEVNAFIETDSSISGIVHLTVFDATDKPVAERLCFVNPLLADSVTFVADKMRTGPRQLNEWRLGVDSIFTHAYAVEVAGAEVPLADGTILSSYWLGDLYHLPGKASWYFSEEGTALLNAIDALLITEQWSRFKWSDVLNNTYEKPLLLSDAFLTYKGTATRNRRPLMNEELNLFIVYADSSRQLVQVRTDSVGSFLIDSMFFRDTAKVLYQVNTKKSSAANVNIQFEQITHFTPFKGTLPTPAFKTVKRVAADTIPQRILAYKNEVENFEKIDERYKQLQEVVLNAKIVSAKEKLNKELSTGLFQSMDEVVFDFENETQSLSSVNIIDWLVGRVAGYTVRRNSDGTSMPFIRNAPAQVYINEMRADVQMASTYPLTDIAMIKVLKNGFALGGSAVAIYTKRGRPSAVSSDASMRHNTITGYAETAPFRTLEYAAGREEEINKDTRSILFWNTNLEAESGNVALRFYNNDLSQNLRLIVTGFSSKGVPVYLNKEIKKTSE